MPAVGPYTPAVRAGDLLYCSGQIGLVDGALAVGFEAQAKAALTNLKNLLEENGSSISDVVKTTVFIVDMAQYKEMNDLYVAAMGEHKPARSAVAAAALPLGALFEIEAIAYLG